MRKQHKSVFLHFAAIAVTFAVLLSAAAATAVSADGADITDKFADPAFRSEVLRALGLEEGSPIYADEAAELESLTVWSEEVRDLFGVEYLTSLKALRVSGTALSSVSLSGLHSLITLSIVDNENLTYLELSDLPSLKSIICERNVLETLTVGSLPALTEIFCRGNRLRILDLTGCPAISEIECGDNLFNSPYAVKVPAGNNYHAQYDDISSSPDEIIIALDTDNETVRSMRLYSAYDRDPSEAERNKTYGRAAVGDVSDFRSTLGIEFEIKSASMLNGRYTESVDGLYTPTGKSNNCFCIKLDGISPTDALRSLAGNEYIRYAEKNLYYYGQNGGQSVGGEVVSYGDVSEEDWFFSNVKFVSENGIMTGTGQNTFSPGSSLTRAMTVTILYRLTKTVYRDKIVYYFGGARQTEPWPQAGFTDVKADVWYTEAVDWAKANGIVKGKTAKLFDPDGAVTRAEFAAMLMRFFEYLGPSDFWRMYEFHRGEVPTDCDLIPDYSKSAVVRLFSAEVMKGRPGGRIDPLATITRAEAAAMIERFTEKTWFVLSEGQTGS